MAVPLLPNATPVGTVTLADHGVGLLKETKNGEPCYELRADLAKGSYAELAQYGCIHPQDAASSNFLVINNQLAVGGAVAPSVATVTVNGQPAPRDGQYFLTVLPTIPDSGVTVVASDKDGRVLSSEEHSKALITSPRIPSQTSPPPKS